MGIEYNEKGIVIQNLSEILTERENKCREFLGDDFNISGESVVANLQSVDADRELGLQELLLYIASQLDPDQAEGVWLDYICALNNITRYSATKSTIPITITGTPNTTKNIGEVTIVNESNDEYYINKDVIVINTEGIANVDFEATSFGEIISLPTSTYSLKTPSIGISSIAYNISGTATIGRSTETDEELRIRRRGAVTYTASSILSSIKASVSQLPEIIYVNAWENDTMNVVDTLPAKSFEVVVDGGDDDEIARAILQKKPAGIQAYGTTTKTISDEDGNNFTIGFTRPTKVPVDLTVTFNASGVQTDTWKNNLKSELSIAFSKIYNVGDDVYSYNLYYVLNSHPEITNVTNFQVKKHSDTTWDNSVSIEKRELATLAVENITLTQST